MSAASLDQKRQQPSSTQAYELYFWLLTQYSHIFIVIYKSNELN